MKGFPYKLSSFMEAYLADTNLRDFDLPLIRMMRGQVEAVQEELEMQERARQDNIKEALFELL
jgi:hypothetical protein